MNGNAQRIYPPLQTWMVIWSIIFKCLLKKGIPKETDWMIYRTTLTRTRVSDIMHFFHLFIETVGYSESPPGSYSTNVPKYLASQALESPVEHANDPPQTLPRYLEKVLLNHKSRPGQDPSLLPIPNHVALNHLYACSIRDNVMAVACTSRYDQKVCFSIFNWHVKYVTTILYKPVSESSWGLSK